MTLAFDLTDEGEIRNLRTQVSEPAGMMDYRVRKSMRIARYRPALSEGVPQPATDVIFEYDFTYYPAGCGERRNRHHSDTVGRSRRSGRPTRHHDPFSPRSANDC